MKKFFQLVAILVVWAACSPDNKTNHKQNKSAETKIAHLKSPINNQMVSRGDKLPLVLEVKANGKDQIDSAIVFVNDKRLTAIDLSSDTFYLKAGILPTGRVKLIVNCYLKGGAQENKLAMLKVLSGTKPKKYGFKVLKTHPHNINSYTQGLLYHNGFLYESTGQKGLSKLMKIDIASGEALQEVALDDAFFGEGLALLNEQLYQLTWQANQGFVYDLESFEMKGNFGYTGEGWGLTSYKGQLVMSNGSNEISFINPQTFQVERTIAVMDNMGEVRKLNELEMVEGEIWANYYEYNVFTIVRINPENGEVLGYIDLKDILDKDDMHVNIDVLNGIAYDPVTKTIYVTGKNYPHLYEIEVFEKPVD
ncbi:glutaminyl-peptide cyclotransferase [bacterium]|nr:glutaminyl-peptide cyclotransferase [bacterium]